MQRAARKMRLNELQTTSPFQKGEVKLDLMRHLMAEAAFCKFHEVQKLQKIREERDVVKQFTKSFEKVVFFFRVGVFSQYVLYVDMEEFVRIQKEGRNFIVHWETGKEARLYSDL